MSLLSSLNTSYSGLRTSQLMVDTTSHNISNANNESYTRQRVQVSTAMSINSGGVQVGQGVQTDQITRIHNEFVYERYRKSESELEFSENEFKFLNEASSYFSDIEGVGIFNDIETYNNAWEAFSINPNDSANKITLAEYTTTMTENINYTTSKIEGLRDAINEQVESGINEFNRLGEKIVEINKQLVQNEAGGIKANDLRDERDKLESAMSKLINISVFKTAPESNAIADMSIEDSKEQYNITIGGYSIINREDFKPLELNNKDISTNLFNINFDTGGDSTNITDMITGGKVGALLSLRGGEINSKSGVADDGKLQKYLDNLDSFTQSLIQNTNNIYAGSAKDSMTTEMLTYTKDYQEFTLEGNTVLSATDLKINTARNTVIEKQPSFNLVAYDNDGNLLASKNIEIDDNSTMNSIVQSINSDTDDNLDNDYTNDINDYFTAEFSDGFLRLKPTQIATLKEYKISMVDDTEVGSNFAGAIGIGRFFDGTNASDIKLNADLSSDALKINPYQAPADGDNTIANAMLQLQYDEVSFYKRDGSEFGSKETLSSFYKMVVTDVASDTSSASMSRDSKEAINTTIKVEFDNISKVSLDEELSSLLRYQTSYQANAKVITTIDRMIDTLLGIKQ